MPLANTAAGALEIRRATVDRVTEVSGGIFVVDLYIDCFGAGEALAQIDFPVRFVEMPHLATGFSMPPSQRLTQGNYPTFSAGVYTWKFGRRPDMGGTYYDGCTLAMVSTGNPQQVITAHLSFRTHALRAPAGDPG